VVPLPEHPGEENHSNVKAPNDSVFRLS
jgi:hypothetical protein